MTKDQHPETSEQAAALLRKAYSLSNAVEAKQLYAKWATTYDKTMLEELGYLTPKLTSELLQKFAPEKEARLLDIGSGTGLAGVELNRLGYTNLDALDYSPEMLAIAQSRDVYVNLIEADLNTPLDIDDEAYDALICTGTFTHAHVGADCLPELLRILKPEGILACTVHKDIWRSSGFEQMSEKLAKEAGMKTLYREPGAYYSKSTAKEGWYIVWQKHA